MDFLLDTHVFIWWNLGGGALSERARAAIADPVNAVWVSAASVWEIAIKRAEGKLRFSERPTVALAQSGFLPLPISALHAEAAGFLDWGHSDPFDRLLVAQAQPPFVREDGGVATVASLADELGPGGSTPNKGRKGRTPLPILLLPPAHSLSKSRH